MDSVFIPKELMYYSLIVDKNRQTIGRFGQTCQENQKWFRSVMICKDPHNSHCASPVCCFLAEPGYIRMQPLVFYAKKYDENKSKNSDAKDMFLHLWRHHDKERRNAIEALRGIKPVTDDNCLEIYAGKYGVQELGNVCQLNTDLAVGIKSTVIASNSFKLKKFLVAKNLMAIQTLLLADTLLFDVDWSCDKNDDYNHRFYDKETTILDCACVLNDIHIINRIVNLVRISRDEDCTIDAMKAMIRNYSVGLLDEFMRANYEVALKERFSLWKYAMLDRSWSIRAPNKDSALDQLFEKIITLLFPGQIDAQDEYQRSLLHWAINENNVVAVEFLIEQGANINLPDGMGFLPLYNAYKSPEITHLLIKNGVDVNQRNAWQRTAIMSGICHASYTSNIRKVMNLLIEAGADASAVDENKKSVLHLYAQHKSCTWHQDTEIIREFLQLGVKSDQEDDDGKTPFDYAQQNGNRHLMDVFNTFIYESLAQKEKLNTPQAKALIIPDAKDIQFSDSLPNIIPIPEKRVNPISNKKIVTMSSIVLFSAVTIYYLLRNIDFINVIRNY